MDALQNYLISTTRAEGRTGNRVYPSHQLQMLKQNQQFHHHLNMLKENTARQIDFFLMLYREIGIAFAAPSITMPPPPHKTKSAETDDDPTVLEQSASIAVAAAHSRAIALPLLFFSRSLHASRRVVHPPACPLNYHFRG